MKLDQRDIDESVLQILVVTADKNSNNKSSRSSNGHWQFNDQIQKDYEKVPVSSARVPHDQQTLRVFYNQRADTVAT